ncbi:MAG: DUF5074 domain-containing protein [Carboxylicivirga sp.]|nr:DUF5074 domain-containing protein [Carboxylicivirga sp.]
MKQIYLFIATFLCAYLSCFAQDPFLERQEQLANANTPAFKFKSTSAAASFTMNDITHWVGKGSKKAALIIQWNDNIETDTLIWGYKWDGEATGEDMLLAITKADPRLCMLGTFGTEYGTALGGLAYDTNLKEVLGIVKTDDATKKGIPNNEGILVSSADYGFDGWETIDAADHWQGGWMNGYWSYWVKESESETWGYSGVGMSSRTLSDGSWDAWSFAVGMATKNVGTSPRQAPMDIKAPEVAKQIASIFLPVDHQLQNKTVSLADVFTDIDNNDLYIKKSIQSSSNNGIVTASIDQNELTLNFAKNATGRTEITVEANSNNKTVSTTFTVAIEQINYTQGYFIVNEDWFGSDNSSVNFVRDNGEIIYRAYRRENEGEMLGITTQFGTIYGDQAYFVSKQTPRLVVVDAHTLKKVASIDEFNPGEEGNKSDGRSFLGVNENLGYIATSKGIYTYSIANNTVGEKIMNTDGETGNMLLANEYIFAVQSNKVLIIKNNEVVSTISGDSYGGLTRSIDGNVWVGAGTSLMKINPYTLENESISLPSAVTTQNTWYAWTANSLCASANENVLYWCENGGWGASRKIYKYVIGDETSLDAPLTTLDDYWTIYGAGLRIDPVTDNMLVTAKKNGWGSNSLHNEIMEINTNTGELINSTRLDDYYWFPAMPMFPDVHAPIFNVSDVKMNKGDAPRIVKLTDIVSDNDNNDASILVNVSDNTNASVAAATVSNGQLIITSLSAGSTVITLEANSNGKLVEKELTVTISTATDINYKKQGEPIKMYPLPFNNQLTIEGADNYSNYKIFSLTGRLVQQGQLNSSSQTIYTDNLNAGTYIISVVSNNQLITRKIIKR